MPTSARQEHYRRLAEQFWRQFQVATAPSEQYELREIAQHFHLLAVLAELESKDPNGDEAP